MDILDLFSKSPGQFLETRASTDRVDSVELAGIGGPLRVRITRLILKSNSKSPCGLRALAGGLGKALVFYAPEHGMTVSLHACGIMVTACVTKCSSSGKGNSGLV